PDQAFIQYNRTIIADPNHAGAQRDIGIFYVKLRKPKEAIPHFESAINSAPDDWQLKNALALEYIKLAINEKSPRDIDLLDRAAILVSHDDAQAILLLGAAYAKKGEAERAIPYLEKAIMLSPMDSDAYDDLAAAYVIKGDMDRAMTLTKQSMILRPNQAAPYVNMGMIYAKKGMLDMARINFSKAMELDSKGEAGKKALTEVQKINSWYR
ncbi:MAG: hypothetical protein ABIH01_01350, partial [Candidatus Omnitrophota bacterium]